jgi:hypothetical protein
MIKKFEQFIKENFCLDLLSEIEQRFLVLDDMDIDYIIEKYIGVTNFINTYQIGYKIILIGTSNNSKISSLIRYFEKFYTVKQTNFAIMITEEIVLSKDELFNLILNIEQVKQVEEFSQDIFNKMIEDDNAWYIEDTCIFKKYERSKSMKCNYYEWWVFFNVLINQIMMKFKL